MESNVSKKVLSNKLDNYLKRYPNEKEKITKTLNLYLMIMIVLSAQTGMDILPHQLGLSIKVENGFL